MNITRIIGLLLLGVMMLTTGCKTSKWTSDKFEGAWKLNPGALVHPKPRLLSLPSGWNMTVASQRAPFRLVFSNSMT